MSFSIVTAFSYSDVGDSYLVSSSATNSRSFISSNDTQNASNNYSYSANYYENQLGSYSFEGETYNYSNNENGNVSTASYVRQTIISDFFPSSFSTYIDNDSVTEYSFIQDGTEERYGGLSVSSSTHIATDSTLFQNNSYESVLYTSSTLQTFFEDGDITEKKVYTNVASFSLATSQSTTKTITSETLYQATEISSTYLSNTVYTQTFYAANNTLFPAQIWIAPSPITLARNISATNFSLISDIGSSFLNSATVYLAESSFVFGTVVGTAETQSFSLATGSPQTTFSYTTSLVSISSSVVLSRNGDSTSTGEYVTYTTLSSTTANGDGTYTWETNNFGSYYDDISIKTIFLEMAGNIILNNGTTLSVENFLKTSYSIFPIKVAIGGSVTFDGVTDSTIAWSTSTENGDSFYQSEAVGSTAFSIPADDTVHLFRGNDFVSTSADGASIYDISYNRGFCAFKSDNTIIYKHLLISKVSGGGDQIFENLNASENTFQTSYASNSNFTSFISNNCSNSFMDSTFELTSGGTFYISSNGDLYNLGGTNTTINVNTNATLASIFTRNSTNTQILELKLSNTIPKSFWNTYFSSAAESSYYQFSTNGKLVLHPGVCYFLTIQRTTSIVYSSTLMQPIEGPKIIDFNERDGFALTTAPIFALGAGIDATFYSYAYDP